MQRKSRSPNWGHYPHW